MIAVLKVIGFSVSVMCGGIIFQMRIARGLMRHLVAMLWPRLFVGFNRPGGDMMLLMLFSML